MANDIIKTQWTHDGTYIFPKEVGPASLFKVSYALPEGVKKRAISLASAAPDILEALEEVVKVCKLYCPPFVCTDEVKKAEAAIKKAYGE